MKPSKNIYEWLNEVRKRPGMWVGDKDRLADLETMTHGYYTALYMHGIVEDVPGLNKSQFATWLREKTGIGAALGWSHIINKMHPDPEKAFEMFFVYLEEYQNQPVIKTDPL